MHSHSHHPASSAISDSKEARNVTLIGMVINIILSIVKIAVGTLFHSAALVADGIHSISDLLTDILVLIVTRFSREAPDAEHPYGHGRFETLGTVVLGSLLIAVAGGMIFDSIQRLMHLSPVIPGIITLLVALLSILSKEWLYRYTLKISKKVRSKMLEANAWHHRSDAFSTIVVFVGIAGAMMGISWLDPLAEFIVSLMVGKMGLDLAWSSIKELVDTALSVEETKEIRDFIKQIPGVRNVHDLRSRLMGADVLLDVHIQVSSSISVSEGHQIGLVVTQSLYKQFPNIKDITFHIDAEADEHSEVNRAHQSLPLRKDLLNQLELCWGELLPPESIKNLKLHYLNHKVSIEVFISEEQLDKIEHPISSQQLKEACTKLDFIEKVSLWKRL
jgi:cation diffusion facilitator family transporter